METIVISHKKLQKLYKCPFCEEYFEPQRSNQLYCCNHHAVTARNHRKKMRNPEAVLKIRAQLANLKLLTTLEINGMVTMTMTELSTLGFDWSGITSIENPINSHSEFKSMWLGVFGFAIRKLKNKGDLCWILSPAGMKCFKSESI